uniref:Aminopeptidase P N-terminal domain-containing protein n=1 Tax=Romanomermis culicivorax TaxID=13658 RepID=A0A915HRG2_ROMCU
MFLKIMTTKLNEFSRGTNNFSVPMRLFQLNRQRLCQALQADSTIPKGSFVVLQGGSEIPRYNTDVNYVFRQKNDHFDQISVCTVSINARSIKCGLYNKDKQGVLMQQSAIKELHPFKSYGSQHSSPFLAHPESFFHWAFGVEEPDFFGAVNIQTGKSFLFMPELPESYAVWLGKIHDQTHFRCKYDVDAMHKILKNDGATKLFLLRGRNTDSNLLIEGADFDKLSEFSVDYEKLYPVIAELRVFKTDLEIELLRYICRVSSEAHMHVMKVCKPGMYEFQMERLAFDYFQEL